MPETQLELRHEKLSHLHPSDIARIVDSLAYPQAAELMEAPDNVSAAAISLTITAGGAVKAYETTPLMTTDEGIEAMRKGAAAAAACVGDFAVSVAGLTLFAVCLLSVPPPVVYPVALP